MKAVFKLLSAVLVTAIFGLASCSNNDEPKSNQPTEPSYKNVLSQGLPTDVDGATFTTNDKGQVTSIFHASRDAVIVTFEYGVFNRDAATYDVLMKVIDWYGDCNIYIQTNNQGFATHALEVDNDGDSYTATWDFEYNSDGQLINLKRSEGGDNFKFTYTNGDITKVVEDDEDGDHYETVFKYTDAEHPNGIPNKGNIMLYEDMYVDMDQMDLAYYAGLLGKSTKNLPLERIESNNTEKYNWVLNNNGLPTELNGYTYFSWK